MYTGVHSDISWESYSFKLFYLPLNVPLVWEINQGYLALCIPVDFFDLRCESVTYNIMYMYDNTMYSYICLQGI